MQGRAIRAQKSPPEKSLPSDPVKGLGFRVQGSGFRV